MAIVGYTLEQAEAEIAELRGQLALLAENHGLSDATDVPVAPGAGNGSALYSQAGAAQHITGAGVAGTLPVTLSDQGTTTVTAATAQTLSAVWAIPANDASQGTAYRITAWGNGTWGSTQQQMNFGIGFPGTTEFGTHQTIAAAALGSSAVFRWNASLWIILITAPGVSATWNGSLNLAMSQTANTLNPGIVANQTLSGAQGPSSNVTQDTTAPNSFSLIAWWASTTGAPTITCHGTIFERIAA